MLNIVVHLNRRLLLYAAVAQDDNKICNKNPEVIKLTHADLHFLANDSEVYPGALKLETSFCVIRTVDGATYIALL